VTAITGDHARGEEIVDELAQHLAQRYEESRAAGATDAAAMAAVAAELCGGARVALAIRAADRIRPAARVQPPFG
jgi:predicted  nucleic acid-binding Zn-ribbon protein